MSHPATGHSAAYIAELKRRLNSHRKWVVGTRGGMQADLSFHDMSQLPLGGVVLRNAKLVGTSFARSNLSRADLKAAVLMMAELEGADLSQADLLGADLRGACFNGANLAEANLAGADLRTGSLGAVSTKQQPSAGASVSRRTELMDANLNRAILVGSNLGNCDLTGAELVDADLSGADLTGAILVSTDLSGATLKNTTLTGAVLSGAVLDADAVARMAQLGINPDGNLESLGERLFELLAHHQEWLDSEGRAGQRLELDLADLSDAPLGEVDLSAAKIQRCNLRNANLTGSNLMMADLSYSNLSGADLSGANLSGCGMRRVNLTGGSLRDSVLLSVPVGDLDRPWPTNLQYARLNDCDLRCRAAAGVILRHADLTGARVNMALMKGSDTSGAKLPTTRG
ncbi:pentapeptide repeat-containing protein [Skermanella pratensis]|uniref:pentapeptide repeat-containing protein n=1 Tax=Skermanella pratensis TaxID=2233999 RepID=UPI0013017A77|nr:pentapeptide repeat-containing protein [Skermanella pratensis]